MKTTTQPKEVIGRSYDQVRYGLHSRRAGGEWGGTNHYKTKGEAEASLRQAGTPILGGMVSFDSGNKERIEYRIVRVESTVTVEHVEERIL